VSAWHCLDLAVYVSAWLYRCRLGCIRVGFRRDNALRHYATLCRPGLGDQAWAIGRLTHNANRGLPWYIVLLWCANNNTYIKNTRWQIQSCASSSIITTWCLPANFHPWFRFFSTLRLGDYRQYWFEIVNNYCQRFLSDIIGLVYQQLLSTIIVSNYWFGTFGTNQTLALELFARYKLFKIRSEYTIQ